MVHKPKHKVHSFRGLLGDGGQYEINLERQNVNLAFRIVKFQIIANLPGAQTQESVVKIWKEEQYVPGIDAVIDFNDAELLGAAFYRHNDNSIYAVSENVIFENTLFSRNIWVTQKDQGGGAQSCNYYIELEEVPVNASILMQLKLGTARRIKTRQSMGN